MHFWRVPRDAWSAQLAAVRELGFEIVAAPVPWGVHEVAPGTFDFTGARDLPAFLAEVRAAGLLAALEPGPHIDLTLPDGGLPARVVRDPAMQARTARDTPAFLPALPGMAPLPSHASRRFQDAARAWLDALGELLAPHLFPAGPVVALEVGGGVEQVFRLGAYDLDYHPDALAWWQEAAGAAGLEGRDPPRAWDPSDPARCAAWVRFKEEYAARALGWVAAALDGAGLGAIARLHIAPPSRPEAINLPRSAAALGGPCGAAFLHRAADHREVRRAALHLGASARPAIAAVGVGGAPWLPPVPEEQQAEVARGVLAGGARGLRVSGVVDRDRWVGAALGPGARPAAARLRALLATWRAAGWTALRRRAPAALVVSRAESRFALASSAADPLPPLFAELLAPGPAGAAELALDRAPALHRRWEDAVLAALDRAGLGAALLDEEAPDEPWAAPRLLILPTLDRVDRATWRRLREAAARGARVVIGPGRPSRDELDRPLGEDAALPRRVGLMRAGSLDDIDGLARDLAAAAGEDAAAAPVRAAGGEVHVSIFEDAGGAPRAVLVGNPQPGPCTAVLSLAPGLALRDPGGGGLPGARGAEVELPLGPHAVRLLLVAGA